MILTLVQLIAVRVFPVGQLAKVAHSGSSQIIVCPGVHQAAGGVDLTGQDISHSFDAALARAADPQSCIDAVVLTAGFRVQEVQFQSIGTVDQDNDLFEGTLLLQSLELLEHLFFSIIQLQVVGNAFIRNGGIAVLVGCQIVALTAHTGEHHDSSIAVGSKGVFQTGFCMDHAPRHFIDGEGAAVALHFRVAACILAAGAVAGLVEIPQSTINAHVPLFQSGLQGRGVIGHFHRAGTRTAVHGIHDRVAEQAHLRAGSQRQSTVVVLQQNSALCLHLTSHFFLMGCQIILVFISGLEVGVVLVAIIVDLIVGGAEVSIQRNCIVVCDHCTDHCCNEQDRQDASHYGFWIDLTFFLFHTKLLFFFW